MFTYNPNTYIADLNEIAVYDAVQHAKECFPNESCGIIVDEEYMRFENESENPDVSFEIKNQTFYDLYIDGKVECLVHSHNDSSMASFTDLTQQIEMDIPWLIINLKNKSLMDCIVFGHEKMAPLEGRPFFYGAFDCLTLVSDYYKIRNGRSLPQPPKEWGFWEKGQSLFEDGIANDPNAYEVPITDIREGDLLFYNLFGSKLFNHIAIVDNEDLVWHHMVGRLSGRYPKSYNRKYLSKVMRTK